MKKIFLFSIMLMTATGYAADKKKSEDKKAVFAKGDKVLSVGVAPVSSLGIPINLAFELGVKDKLGPGNLGIGGVVGYAGRKYTIGTFDYTVTSLIIGARGQYHYQFVDKLDTYAGVILGYNVASVKWPSAWSGIKPTYGGPVYGGFIGARYYFTPAIAAMAELGGGGLGVVNAGLAFKF